MDLDDAREFSDEESESPEQRIEEYIRSNHPEFLLPGSHVNQDFIKLVIYGDLLEETVGTPVVLGNSTDITDEEIEAVLERLPSEVISNPVSIETIDLIIEESFLVQEERHLKEVLDAPCVTAADYNYRAYARAEFERVGEAIEDYQKAYDLEPGNYSHLIEKAQLLVETDMQKPALSDAKYVCDRLMSSADARSHIDDFVRLADIFRQCDSLKLAFACIAIVVNTLRSVIPHGEESPVPDLGERSHQEPIDVGFTLGLLQSFIEDVSFENENDPLVSGMIARTKEEVNILKTVAGA